MLKDAFDSIQCLIYYKTFKEFRGYVLKRYFVCNRLNMNNLNDTVREEFILIDKK